MLSNASTIHRDVRPGPSRTRVERYTSAPSDGPSPLNGNNLHWDPPSQEMKHSRHQHHHYFIFIFIIIFFDKSTMTHETRPVIGVRGGLV